MSNVYIEDIKLSTKSINWDKFTNKSVMILGATGLIGRCIVDFFMLSNKKTKVYAVGRNTERAKKIFFQYAGYENFKFIEHNVIKSFQRDYFESIDYIINAASGVTPNVYASKPVDVMLANIIGMHNVLMLAQKYNSKVIYISSAELYGECDVEIKSESDYGYIDHIDTRAAYPISKKAAETLAVSYNSEYGVETLICRLSHVYGPTMTEEDNRAASEFIRAGCQHKDIVLRSSKQILRTYTYVVDAVNAIIYLMINGKYNEVYNVANSESVVSVKEFAEIVSLYTEIKVIFKELNNGERHGYTQISRQVIDCNKIALLGWKGIFDINTGIYHTIKSYKCIKE